MSTLAKLFVELGMDNRGLKRGVADSKKEMGGWRKFVLNSLSTAGGFLAANVIQKGISTVTSQIGGVIGAASDMAETTSKVNQVFGSGAADILKWGGNAEAMLGLSDKAALEAAGTIGNLFKGIGIGTDKLPGMSKAILQASADLGSFNNENPAQVFADLKSGLVGQAEPLQKYGILINESAVSTELARLGLDKLTGTQLEAAKVQARYNLIMGQLGDANGDFAKTAGGAANGARTLRAYLQGVQVWIGGKLLPTYTKAIAGTNRFAKTFGDFRAQGFSPFMAGINALQKSLTNVFGAEKATSITAMILDARDKIVPLFQDIRRELPKLADRALALGKTVMHVLVPALGFVADHFSTIAPLVLSLVGGFKTYQLVMRAVAIVQGIVSTATAILTAVMGTQAVVAEEAAVATEAAWLSMLGPIALVVAAVALFALAYHKNWFGIRDITNRVIGWVTKQFMRFVAILKGGKGLGKALEGLPKPLQKVAILARRIVVLFDDIIHGRWDQVRGDIDKIGKTLGNLLKSLGLKNFGQEFKRAFDLVVTLFSDVITLIGDLIHGRWGKLWGDFLDIVKDIGRLAIEYFRLSLSLWKDVLRGLGAVFGAIPWGTIWDELTSALSWLVTDGVPLVLGYGKDLIGALFDGAVAIWRDKVRPWLHDRIAAIANALGDFYRAAYGWGSSLINGIWDSVTTLWGNVTGWISGHLSPSAIAGYLGDWYSSAWGWGASLLRGIQDGISAGWDAFKGWLQGIWDALPSWAKKAWGVASPSKVMRGLGVHLVEGLHLGIASELPALARQVGKMNATISGGPTKLSLATRAVTPPAVMASGTGGAGSTRNLPPITIIVNGANKTNEEVADVVSKVILRRIGFSQAGMAT